MSRAHADAAWLKEPSSRAVLKLVRLHLRLAHAAAKRLESGEADVEALHDFRIALRRLRACLRGYRDVLPRAAARALIAGLKRLAEATNAARDEEVYLARLEKFGSQSDFPPAPAMEAFIVKLRRRLARHEQERQQKIVPAFKALSAPAAHKLSAPGPWLKAAKAPMSKIYEDALDDSLRGLSRRLSRIDSMTDARDMHQARIRAKRARYLIEPFRDEVRKSRKTLSRLARLQDALGELHDASGLRDFLSQGRGADKGQIRALRRALKRREKKIFKRLRRDWLGKNPRLKWPRKIKLEL